MRYIRFLKPPRIIHGKSTSKEQVNCLITITSDLGDSFLPCDVLLSTELLSANTGEVIVWKTVQWTAGIRALLVTLPLSKSCTRSPLRIRIGTEPKSGFDDYSTLAEGDGRGVVSAWSAPVNTSSGKKEAAKIVERRFCIGTNEIHIWEETGESIARHMWDAGITISCHMNDLLARVGRESSQLLPKPQRALKVLELGTGCGMVGISIAQVIEGAHVMLTDLSEAEEIVKRNIQTAKPAKDSTLEFRELDWEEDLPASCRSAHIGLVIAADCTYNPDSCPALVNTCHRIAKASPNVFVAIAMKIRHSSEEIFFDLMRDAGFHSTQSLAYPLPGDEKSGEETVHLYVYRYDRGRKESFNLTNPV
ncbi:hypothetical protein BU26DRAFT_528170 [Trematosphaeria pertusa]|uniref:Uncharacterized protein n=1 Tax=Trematosphaeria pertusa TaxID=390896 RepID=A0A6A6IYV1_9PLEO|nr:uncharacterized protein BU26DRAFT_528170 [Trematosphaeria pertusa]KAF2255478.1 hypothetical protein BU26DRAFT_528170 [Trematosphaeria pertusa]